MTGIDPGRQADLDPAQQLPSHPQPAGGTADSPPDAASAQYESGPAGEAEGQRRRILIGSQRDPAAYRARRQRDWVPVADDETSPGEDKSAEGGEGSGEKSARRRRRRPRGQRGQGNSGSPPVGLAPSPPAEAGPPLAGSPPAEPAAGTGKAGGTPVEPAVSTSAISAPVAGTGKASGTPIEPAVTKPPLAEPAVAAPPVVEPPVTAAELDLGLEEPPKPSLAMRESEDEFAEAMGGMSLDDLMTLGDGMSQETALEPESKHQGRVVGVRRDDVFIEMGGREQGCMPLRLFPEPPTPGALVEVVVVRFHPEEGLYDLALPGTAAAVGNWDEVREGMMVEAQVTGHNTGGLECDVNHIRGFIPVSQVALYRVEDIAQFVGQRFLCLITEANPMRRNLVLSRRAVLEREKEEARQKFFDSLAPGQVHEGVVRKLMDFGAFVDIGGADGLLHVSQLAWGRVNHPSEVLSQGQAIKVRIEKVDRQSGRISLAYRDMLENPWSTAAAKYPPNSVVRGKVTKLMEFGAFVELEPGVEGLIHISELSHKRVWRASDVVHEGDDIEVLVLSVNTQTQRISLSIKALSKPEPTKKEKEEAEPGEIPAKPRKAPDQPLQGGLGKSTGSRFGLNW